MAFYSSARVMVLLALAVLSCAATVDLPRGYSRRRDRLIARERALRTGGKGHSASLSAQEMIVDKLLMADKRKRTEDARVEGKEFPMNFLTSRAAMEDTTAFRIIQKMPKGALLHVHKPAMASLAWVVKNLTYRPHLHMCVDSDFDVKFQFFAQVPPNPECDWKLVSAVRSRHGNAADFDRTLYRNLSLVTPNPAAAYPNINAVWDVFEGYFNKMGGLLKHAHVWKDYVWQSLYEFVQDKVQYVEIRGSLPELYELDGTVHDREWAITNSYIPVVQEFRRQYPNFSGIKLIMTTFRGKSPEEMKTKVQEATAMFQKYPDMVVGFDIVGQEDRFRPLSDFIDAFMYPSTLDPPVHLPYFFHAGETVWQETASDYNLVDALLLNATRIGHGYALTKHPRLLAMVKKGKIAVEISPISNQVLKLVEDLRNHPATMYLANNLSLVISSDDPACWDALPLSHDFYLAFMALTGQDAGLATLKQLALNSLTYSAMTSSEKEEALKTWEKEWNTFITEIGNTPQDRL